MNPRSWIPLFLIGAVAWFAGKLGFDAIERDRADRVASERRSLDVSCEELAGEWDRLLATQIEAAARGDEGVRLWLSDRGAVSAAPPPPELSEEVRTALRIGEELVRADEPERAIDALTFRLPAEGPGRTRLLWSATLAARDVPGWRKWRQAVLERIAAVPCRAEVQRVPIDLLAAWTLRAEFDVSHPSLSLASLESRLASIDPVGLAAVLRGISPTADELLARVNVEVDLWQEVAAAGEWLRREEPVLSDRRLFLPEFGGDSGGVWVTAVSLGDRLPRPPRGVTAQREAPDAPPFVHVRGTPIASLRLEDPGLDDRATEFARRAERLQLGWFLVVLIVSIAAWTTWRALERKRRLAALRMRLLANVSHELKTPVTSLRMFGELLESGKLPPERVSEFGGRITLEAKRLGTRIEQILETAQAEGGAPLDTGEAIDLPALVAEVVEEFRGRLASDGSSLTIHASSEDTAIFSNRDALERILENLIDNGLKYGRSPAGAELVVTVTAKQSVAEISVEDRGPGITRADQERIFEPFYRASFDDYATAGTGLGLSISRQFAERLGGSLHCSDRSGGGTVFTLALPRSVASGAKGAAK